MFHMAGKMFFTFMIRFMSKQIKLLYIIHANYYVWNKVNHLKDAMSYKIKPEMVAAGSGTVLSDALRYCKLI